MKAVIYARFSCEKQNEQSIEGQERECRQYAEANNISIVDIYVDRAVSGRSDNRADFQRMLRDSAARHFDVVLVYKVDRFGRNREEIAMNKIKLRRNGVKVLYAKESIPDGPEGILLESLLEGLAEYYSADLSQKVLRGMRETALKCKSNGGTIPLGYKINSETKYFEIDQNTAPIVREIFDLYANGNTIIDITSILNKKYLLDKSFKLTSYHTLLCNKKYIGVYKYGDIQVVGGVPAIIDKKTFDKVQARLAANKRAPARSKAKVDYMFTGKMFCGICGSTMVGESGRGGNGSTYNYYKCLNRKHHNACGLSPSKKEWLENYVIEKTRSDILQPKVIEHIADRMVKLQNEDREKNEAMAALKNKLKEVDQSLSNYLRAIESGVFNNTTNDRMKELEDQKIRLENEIAHLEIKSVKMTRDQIIFWISKFSKGDISDPVYKSMLVDTFIHSITVYEKEIAITYNYCDGNPSEIRSDNLAMVNHLSQYPNIFINSKNFILLISKPGA